MTAASSLSVGVIDLGSFVRSFVELYFFCLFHSLAVLILTLLQLLLLLLLVAVAVAVVLVANSNEHIKT